MILIGQYDSSFVRRVGIALRLYDMAFEHRPWSVFGDAERIRALNPLVRVPVLVLADGTALGDSHVILSHLDALVSPERVLLPPGPERHSALRVIGWATGLADKAVSLFYEKRLHSVVSEVWAQRCRSQLLGALAALEADRAARSGEYWFGGRIGHADIAVAAALRHAGESHPDLIRLDDHPALQAHAAGMEALPVFQEISQPFIAPA